MKSELLLYANSRTSADILYFSGVSIHDDYFCFTIGDKKCALLSPLEVGRARRASALDEIFDYSEVAAAMPKNAPKKYVDAVAFLLKKRGVRALAVPANFPISAFAELAERGFDMAFCDGDFLPERAVKTRRETAQIERANGVASECFALVEDILRKSKISGKKLLYKGEILTCEFLRAEIEKLSISLGADALDTIAACGDGACDPHEVGRGAVLPHSLIVFDIFPRLRESGYFGDMTRTFLKGEPTPQQAALVDAVLRAQKIGLKAVRAGVDGAKVHAEVAAFFEKSGYKTELKNGKWGGFFHSTGHGVGLDVHESPSLGSRKCILESGNVVTVEPGLYYRGIGGCRIEDNVLVQKSGAKLLSHYHYNWIID